jgi:hypothetical protein
MRVANLLMTVANPPASTMSTENLRLLARYLESMSALTIAFRKRSLFQPDSLEFARADMDVDFASAMRDRLRGVMDVPDGTYGRAKATT